MFRIVFYLEVISTARLDFDYTTELPGIKIIIVNFHGIYFDKLIRVIFVNCSLHKNKLGPYAQYQSNS